MAIHCIMFLEKDQKTIKGFTIVEDKTFSRKDDVNFTKLRKRLAEQYHVPEKQLAGGTMAYVSKADLPPELLECFDVYVHGAPPFAAIEDVAQEVGAPETELTYSDTGTVIPAGAYAGWVDENGSWNCIVPNIWKDKPGAKAEMSHEGTALLGAFFRLQNDEEFREDCAEWFCKLRD